MGQARERDPASTSYVGKAAAGIRSRALARRRTLRAMRIRRASDGLPILSLWLLHRAPR
jgi:hypothetical protein